MKKTAIMQPTYLPWLGYFDLIDQVDAFVFLDSVQLVKRSWQVRNKVKTAHGELFLTVPIKNIKGRDETTLCSAFINNSHPWRNDHIRSMEFSYRKARYFNEVFPFVKELIERDELLLSEFNIGIIRKIAERIRIRTEFIYSSELKNTKGTKDALLVSICKEISCDGYISPRGAFDYIEKNLPGGEFTKEGIRLFYNNYVHPDYTQIYGEFIPYMSVIDLLFNHGFEESLGIIRSGRRNLLTDLKR